MIFQSTNKEAVKRHKTEVSLGHIKLEEGNLNAAAIVNHINKVAKAKRIKAEDIKYQYKYDSGDEYTLPSEHLVFFYERDETDSEYVKRIEELERKDLHDSITEVRRFMVCVNQKEELRKLYHKLVTQGRWKGMKDKVFEEFLSKDTVEDRIKRVREEERDAAKEQAIGIKNKLLKVLPLD